MDYSTIRSYARENRKKPTLAEERFWALTRGKQVSDLKFNRQYVIPYKLHTNRTRYFIADFYCHQLKLVIELDGRIHDFQKEYDINRDAIMNAMGLKVIRFSNEEVFSNWDDIVDVILTFMK